MEQGARILVVDDDANIVQLIADIFEDEHEVLFALNGESAGRIADTTRPDLVLMDVVMPGMDLKPVPVSRKTRKLLISP